MPPDVLTLRALNRATLQRQLLLERVRRPLPAVVSDLVGLQAQEPLNPYTALWSRVVDFRPDELGGLVEERRLVRIVVMRGTIHLVTAADALELRPLMQPVLDAEIRRHRDFAPRLAGVDLAPVLAFATGALAGEPLTPDRLRALLAERFPDIDAAAAAYACRCHLALVQAPPRGVWGRTKGVGVRYVTAESHLGRPLATAPSLADAVLRYLAAFGPATVADVAAWSRLTGLRAVVDGIRPRLRAFRDERGRELLDLPDAPRPDPGIPAAVRFLPEYDNVLLSHADRNRFGVEELRPRMATGDRTVRGVVLYDGTAIGTWSLDRPADRDEITLVVRSLVPLPRAAPAAIEAEGAALLDFLPEAADRPGRDVRVQAPPDEGRTNR